jgi:hypothetical protein
MQTKRKVTRTCPVAMGRTFAVHAMALAPVQKALPSPRWFFSLPLSYLNSIDSPMQWLAGGRPGRRTQPRVSDREPLLSPRPKISRRNNTTPRVGGCHEQNDDFRPEEIMRFASLTNVSKKFVVPCRLDGPGPVDLSVGGL